MGARVRCAKLTDALRAQNDLRGAVVERLVLSFIAGVEGAQSGPGGVCIRADEEGVMRPVGGLEDEEDSGSMEKSVRRGGSGR
jgi:hypothetical protein